MEINTMRTVWAIYIVCIELWLRTIWIFKISHTNILPRIFDWCNEKNVFTFDVVATVVCIWCWNGWWRDIFVKYCLAEICVKCHVLHLWVDWISLHIFWSLEEAKLIADEPVPCSVRNTTINGRVAEKFHSILSQVWPNMLFVPLLNQVHVIVIPLQVRYHIAELSSQTILNWASKDVSNETHDVFISDSQVSNTKMRGDVLSLFSSSELQFSLNISWRHGPSLCTMILIFLRAQIKIQIITIIHFLGMNDTWWRPDGLSMIWIDVLEPCYKCTWIASTNEKNTCRTTILGTNVINEISCIGQRLLSRQPLQVINGPSTLSVIERLGCTKVPVLKSNDDGVHFVTHGYIWFGRPWCWACPFTTYIDEDGPVSFFHICSCIDWIFNPIPLCKCCCVVVCPKMI